MTLFHVKVQSATIHPEAGIARLRLPNLQLANTKTVSAHLSALKNWDSIAPFAPKKLHMEYPWGSVSINEDEITVFTSAPGEYAIPIPLCNPGKADIALLQLTVIQDPWVLFQQGKEPPHDAPYQKAHTAFFSSSEENVLGRVIAASRRGQGHAFHGTFRDDDFGVAEIPESGLFLLAVADGAGSAKYSRKGSELAVNAAIQSLKSSFSPENTGDKTGDFLDDAHLAELLTLAAKAGKTAIDDEVFRFNGNPLEDNVRVTRHDFNTTLLLSIVKTLPGKGVKIASFAIGDGAIVWVGDKSSQLLSEPDDGDYVGETDFITSGSLWEQDDHDHLAFIKRRVRTLTIDEETAKKGTLLMMTDGVSDPFFSSHGKLEDHGTWLSLLNDEIRGKAKISKGLLPMADCANHLLDWLNFRAKTHVDDRTLLIWELPEASVSSVSNDKH